METGRPVATLVDLEERLELALAGYAKKLGRRPRDLRSLLSATRARALLGGMERRLGGMAGKRTLEFGSGCGLVLALANAEYDADAWGVDPGQGGYDGVVSIAHEVLDRFGVQRSRLLCAAGEGLPVDSAQFDVVCSFYVLEHVRRLEPVLREAIRVLRPGGYLYMVAPNYGSIWEGHYGIPWIPHLHRSAARAYVRLLGRSDEPLDDLNFVTVDGIVGAVRAAQRHSGTVEIDGLGLAEFEERLCSGDTTDLDSARWAGGVLRLLGAMRVARVAAGVAGRLKLWTPLVLVARKADDGRRA